MQHPVIDTREITPLWDTQVQTEGEIKSNKPEIVVKNKKQRICLIMDIAIPFDYNITQKQAAKYIKNKALQIEIHRLWNMKAKVLPVVI